MSCDFAKVISLPKKNFTVFVPPEDSDYYAFYVRDLKVSW